MRDFDSELTPHEDREIKIGGQVFYWRYLHWKDGAKLYDDELDELKQAAGENGDREFSFVADTETAIKRIPMFLEEENDAHKRFKDLMARKTDPVPRYQVVALYKHLVAEAAGFPTPQPSDSSSGAGSNDTSSAEEGS